MSSELEGVCEGIVKKPNSQHFEKKKRQYVKKLIKNRCIYVVNAGNPEVKISNWKYSIKENDVIHMKKKEKEKTIQPQNLTLEIVHDEDTFLIVNKPRGMIVHPSPTQSDGTLINGLLHIYGKDSLSNLEGDFRPGIVHRIDRQTSGLLVIAKNNTTHAFLKQQFMTHTTIFRCYKALVFHHFTQCGGKIEKAIGRHSKNFMKRVTEDEIPGSSRKGFKKAITHYKVLKEYKHKGKKYSLLECVLETGRTHQIRVHLKSIGSVVGDTLYGAKEKYQPFKLSGQMLHAVSLGFLHPKTKKEVLFTSQLPQYFQEIISTLESKV